MVGVALLLAGAGLGAAGQVAGGLQQDKMARYNARLAEQRAKSVELAMAEETEMARDAKRRLRAEQIVGFAKSGAEITSGTPLLVMAEQAGEIERDILQMRRNRMIEAQGLRSQAEMMRLQGRAARTAGYLGAATTLLGGGAKAGSLAGGGAGAGGGGPKLQGYENGIPNYQNPQYMSRRD